MGWVDQQGSKFFRNCLPPASFQQYLTRHSFNTGSPSLWFPKSLQLRDHRKSGQGSFVPAKYLSSDPPSFIVSITCLGWLRSYSQIQMQSRFLQWLSPCPAPEPPCSTHCSVSRHRCAKFLQCIKLCKCITNIYTIPHLCVYEKFTADFFGHFCFKKLYNSKEFTRKKKIEEAPQRKMSVGLH